MNLRQSEIGIAMKNFTLLLLFPFFINACAQQPKESNKEVLIVNSSSKLFNDTWYAGKASVAVYNLKQSRYGESRVGHATLVTVSEGFDGNKQVKADNENSTNYQVLKTNLIKKFNTGLYDYATMCSVFLPVNTRELLQPVKLTFSSQDWCGQVFSQWNKNANKFRYQGFSYFQSEGDIESMLDKAFMQDAIFSSIRQNPKNLPTGEFKMYLSNENYRFLHLPIAPFSATAQLDENDSTYTYNISTEAVDLQYVFTKNQPYTVLSFSESLKKGMSKGQTTVATLHKEQFRAYWGEHDRKDDGLRKDYDLPFFGLEQK